MKSPVGVTILIMTVLIFTSLNALRVGAAIRFWDYLVESPISTPIFYLIITGSIWAGLGITLTVGLLVRQKWSSSLAKISTVVYTIYYWFDRLLIADGSSITSRWPFAVGLSIILLVLTYWILAQPKTKAFLVR